MINNLGYDNLYGGITLKWSVDNPANFNGVRVYLQGDDLTLLATLSSFTEDYTYLIPQADRGVVLNFVVALFVVDDVEAVEYEVATIPNPPVNLSGESKENMAILTWDSPQGKNIKGYLVKRDGEELGVAAAGKYTDIGNFIKPPSSGNSYTYDVATITYNNELSSFLSVNVTIVISERTIQERLSKSVTVAKVDKYRICSVDEDGSRSRWTTFRKIDMPSLLPAHEMQFRIQAITTTGAKSLPLVTKSIKVDSNFEAGDYPTFRLRVIDVDGCESDAIVTVAQDYLWRQKVLINRSNDLLINKSDETLVGREL